MELNTGHHPEWIDPGAWVAPGAVVIGEVHLAEGVSVWYNAVIRGDMAPVFVGSYSNVQEGAVVHVDFGMPTEIGTEVTLGHGAVVHAATVEDGALIGIRAVVLSGARVGEGAVVGAGAVVTEGMVVPPRSLVVGVPARVVRQLEDGEVERLRVLARAYATYAEAHRRAL